MAKKMEQPNCPRIHAMQYYTATVNIYEVFDDLENHLYYNVTWKKVHLQCDLSHV